MTAFRETLENFQAYVLEKNNLIEGQITGPDVEFKRTRLNAYREAYSLRLIEILGQCFPALQTLAGEEFFEQLGHDYLKAYPSNHYSVANFGRHFSRFLAQHNDLDPCFSELATFEWTLEQVIAAPDAPQLKFEDMASIPQEAWANLQLYTHPSLRIIPLHYNVPELWQALRHDQEKPEVKYEEKTTHWLVWRFNLQAYYNSVKPEQLWMINAIREAKCFAEICAGLCEMLSEEEVTQFAAVTLRNWITEGIFSEYKIGDAEPDED